MARTRLVAPDSQATTSTGLNYLLAEDNDNIRVPFGSGKRAYDYNSFEHKINELKAHYKRYLKGLGGRKGGIMTFEQFAPMFAAENFAEGGRTGFSGGGMGRRAFLKLMAALTGGAAAVKSGILGLGGGTGKKAVTETVKKAGAANEVPPYFFKLVDKIKTLGDETMATQDKAIAKKYKDYVMEEDFAGNITIIKKNMDDPYPEEVIMSYKVDDVSLPSGKGYAKVDEYEEFTARPDFDGKMKDVEGGVPDEVIEEAMTETITKKADGGRIGFSGGGIFRAIIAKAAAAKGMKPYEFIKVTSYKSLPREVKMFMSAEDFAKLKTGQEQLYNNYIDMMKTRKNFQQEVEAGKKTPASPIFEHMEKTMDKQSYVPKTVTADDIAEAELMVKNRFQKGRKDNAQGGLQTMLGE